ncbi:hypothetical protein NQ317_017947 [Molorchus minor]|uniref:Uncharacterized protein n=1 Tax=Molorchus minor TaxID=1323400 RepID=A0ABQ9JEA8_9CUCU|nr:hypothetical protein NQ317_017947 [Molorchus minor]
MRTSGVETILIGVIFNGVIPAIWSYVRIGTPDKETVLFCSRLRWHNSSSLVVLESITCVDTNNKDKMMVHNIYLGETEPNTQTTNLARRISSVWCPTRDTKLKYFIHKILLNHSILKLVTNVFVDRKLSRVEDEGNFLLTKT